MVGVLASSAVNHGFEPRLRLTKDYKFGICFFSAKHAALVNNCLPAMFSFLFIQIKYHLN